MHILGGAAMLAVCLTNDHSFTKAREGLAESRK